MALNGSDNYAGCNGWRKRYGYRLVGPPPPARIGTTERDVQLVMVPTERGDTPYVVRVTADRYSFSLASDLRDRKRLHEKTGPEAVAVVAEMAGQLIADQLEESLYAFFFNFAHALIGYTEIARGGINIVCAEPRAVMRPVIILGASAVILAHNHPGGDPTPSEADVKLAARMGDWLDTMGIVLVDSVVVSQDGWSSVFAVPPPDTTNPYRGLVE